MLISSVSKDTVNTCIQDSSLAIQYTKLFCSNYAKCNINFQVEKVLKRKSVLANYYVVTRPLSYQQKALHSDTSALSLAIFCQVGIREMQNSLKSSISDQKKLSQCRSGTDWQGRCSISLLISHCKEGWGNFSGCCMAWRQQPEQNLLDSHPTAGQCCQDDEAAWRQHSLRRSGMLVACSAGSSSTGSGGIQTTLLPFKVEVGSLLMSCLMFFHEYWIESRN